MAEFSYNKGYFPFCVKTANPEEENSRYNSFFSDFGYSGFGKIYPIGMMLVDAMALYWKLKSINWNFFFSWGVDGERSSGGETYWVYDNSSIYTGSEEIYKPPDLQDGAIKYDILRKRGCSDFKDEDNVEFYRPDFTNSLRGYVSYNSGDFFLKETPMSCFFAPYLGSSVDDYQNPEFARIIYDENSKLYYPSIFVFYWGYSRLYCNQKFLGEGDNREANNTGGDVPLSINNNVYNIQLLEIFNYTPSPPVSGSTGSITCNLA
jgi:hypothetical protein